MSIPVSYFILFLWAYYAPAVTSQGFYMCECTVWAVDVIVLDWIGETNVSDTNCDQAFDGPCKNFCEETTKQFDENWNPQLPYPGDIEGRSYGDAYCNTVIDSVPPGHYTPGRYDLEGAAEIMGDDCDFTFRVLDHNFAAYLCCDASGNFDGELCQ